MTTPTFIPLNPSQTASQFSTYVPPFATGTTFTATHGLTQVASGTTLGGIHATGSSAFPANPTVPSFENDVSWVTAYLMIHSLPQQSYVYGYILWMAVVTLFFLMALARLTGMRGGALSAWWSKWALRRRTWRKKHALMQAAAEARKRGVSLSSVHKQPTALPSNAQLLTFAAIVVLVVILCVAGPDYINPDASIFSFSDTGRRMKRDSSFDPSIVPFFTAHYTIDKALWTSAARTGDIAFAVLPLCVLLALKAPPFAAFAVHWGGFGPGLHFDKLVRLHRWAGRMVWVASAAHVVMWCIQLARDKRAGTDELAWDFVWEYTKFRCGWAAFGILTLMVLLSFESLRSRHFEIFYGLHVLLTPAMLITAAFHHPPIWWWCWAALALWIGERLYRVVWWVYVNGVFSERHAKGGIVARPTATGGEKNVLRRSVAPVPSHEKTESWEMGEIKAPVPNHPAALKMPQDPLDPAHPGPRSRTPDSDVSSDYRSGYFDGLHRTAFGSTPGLLSGMLTPIPISTPGAPQPAPSPAMSATPTPGEMTRSQTPASFNSRVPLNNVQRDSSTLSFVTTPGGGPFGRPKSMAFSMQGQPGTQGGVYPSQYVPPPGFAHATLLPGRTVRLRLVTPGYLTWAPGQHFLVGVPAISKYTTHPFSVASVCDEQAAVREQGKGGSREEGRIVQAEAGREMVLLVRAKKGWTKRLWDLVFGLQERGESLAPGESLPLGYAPPPRGTGAPHAGVVLRTLVDGPFGSSARARWGTYSSVLIVAGGSGVSFGTSILEYVCLCLAGRDGRFLGGKPGGYGMPGWKTQRVRFVWLVREYAHIQWVATALRRCLEIMPNNDALEINVFVTNFRPPKELAPPSIFAAGEGDDELMPPALPFAKKGRPMSVASEDSLASDGSVDSITDLYFGMGDGDAEGGHVDDSELGHEAHVLDYTNFDDDDDTPLPGESQLSRKLKKEGKLRRAKTRKTEKALAAKAELDERVGAGVLPSLAHGQGKLSSDKDNKYASIDAGNHRFSTVSSDPLLATPDSPTSSTTAAFSPYHDQTPSWSKPQHLDPLTRPPFPHEASSDISSHRRSWRPRPQSTASSWTFDAKSPVPGPSDSVRWTEPLGPHPEISGLTLDPEEIYDLRIVSEVTRPGKPKLDRILSDEVERAKGRVVVACCGPTSLNALMRKLIAAKIDPKRVWKGDMRGSIDFICEDFDY